MFFRSRNGKESLQPALALVQSEAPESPPGQAEAPPAVAATSAAPAVGAAAPADKHLPPEELRKRAEVSRRLAATMGRIVRLMAKSPRHRDHSCRTSNGWPCLPSAPASAR
jgi:hypothetical protein